jgi:hypothetical protein
MHFSIAMELPAFWLVYRAMLVRKSGGVTKQKMFRCRRAAWAEMPRRAGQTAPDDFLKFR